MYKLASRPSRLGLGVIVALICGVILGTAPSRSVQAQTVPAAQWQPTKVQLPASTGSSGNTCVDATQADTMQVQFFDSQTNSATDTYAINWKTGARQTLTPSQFDLCVQSQGLLGMNQTANAVAPSPKDHYIQVLSHDGSSLFYDARPNGDPSKGFYLYVSTDGVNWQQRPKHFVGTPNRRIVVADNDVRTVYVLASDGGPSYTDKRTLYLSHDAGVTWQIIPSSTANAEALELSMLPGHNTPYDRLLLRLGSTPEDSIQLSIDGGRTFGLVGTFFGGSPHYPGGNLSVFQTNINLLRFHSQPLPNTYGSKYDLATSIDQGKSWQPKPLPFSADDTQGVYLNQLTYSPDSFIVTYYQAGKVSYWLSTDAAQSWQTLPAPPSSTNPINPSPFGGFLSYGVTPSIPGVTPYAPSQLLQFVDGKLYTLDISQADQNLTTPTVPNGAPTGLYNSPTSHNLSPLFRPYWEQHGGLAQFGYPRTEVVREANPSDGKVYAVQYFERNRFEYHPEFAGTPNEVLLGLLGNQLTADRRSAGEAPFKGVSNPNASDKVYFDLTGHTLGGTFRKYWEANGGLALYGYPISEEFQEKNPDDGKTYTVQYFERNRFEYHPEFAGTKYEVLLGLLGNTLLKQKNWLN